jgi:hypothetical protein
MIFSNTSEIQQYLPVAVTFNFESIRRFLIEAEWEHLVPLLGRKQYEILVRAYTEGQLQAHEKELLDKCRYAVSSFAYQKYLPWGQVQINSAGIQIVSNENMKTAFQWQIEDLQGSALRSGHAALEQVILYLQAEARLFPHWLQSEAYEELHRHFITNATEFSRYAGQSFDRYAFVQMRHLLAEAERRLRKVTGSKLFEELRRQHQKNNLGKHQLRLLDFVRPALVHFTVARSINTLSLRLSEQGITVADGKMTNARYNRVSASPQKLQILQEQAEQATEAAFQEIKDFLDENHYDFPAYPFEMSTIDTTLNPSGKGGGVYGVL